MPKGILVVIGGAEDKGIEKKEENSEKKDNEQPGEEQDNSNEILRAFVKLMRKESPLIEVVTTSSGEPDGAFEDYKKVFGKLGVRRVHHMNLKNRGEVLDDKLEKRVQEADAFFFTGGDQLKLTSIYGGTPFLTDLKNRYISDRIIIGGTSAGAMALSTPMINAGSKEKQ